jgi:hypothetical protein
MVRSVSKVTAPAQTRNDHLPLASARLSERAGRTQVENQAGTLILIPSLRPLPSTSQCGVELEAGAGFGEEPEPE